MAINLGTEAIEAIRELRDSPHFARFVAGFGQVAQMRVFAAMTSPVEQRIAQTSHAHGVYEAWEAVHAAHANIVPAQVKPPPLPATVGPNGRRGNRQQGEGILDAS